MKPGIRFCHGTVFCIFLITLYGAHYWNQQQEQWNGDAEDCTAYKRMFLEHSSDHHRLEYYPRLVSVDTAGSFGGSVKGQASAGEQSPNENGVVFHEISAIHKETNTCLFSTHPKPTRHPFNVALNENFSFFKDDEVDKFNLGSTVKYFTDYFVPQLDVERNIVSYNDLIDTSLQEGIFFWDEYTNKLRKHLEDMDALDCCNLHIDWLSPLSHLGLLTLEWLHEEIGKPSFFIGAWNSPQVESDISDFFNPKKERLRRQLDGCRLINACIHDYSNCRALVLSDYDQPHHNDNLYNMAAVPALSLECLTGPFFSLPPHFLNHTMLQLSPLVNLYLQCTPVKQVDSLTPLNKEKVWDLKASYKLQSPPSGGPLPAQEFFKLGALHHIPGSLRDLWRNRFKTPDQLFTLDNPVSLNITFPHKMVNVSCEEHQLASGSWLSAEMDINECFTSGLACVKDAYEHNQLFYEAEFEKSYVKEVVYNLFEYMHNQKDIAQEIA